MLFIFTLQCLLFSPPLHYFFKPESNTILNNASIFQFHNVRFLKKSNISEVKMMKNVSAFLACVDRELCPHNVELLEIFHTKAL